ncbi:MAG TPA: hypothetical protein VI461_14460 [Chitinophagaceae bacterium]|nr:hypothetical protein [Chitinophagaceae bacterium]
MKKLLLLSVCLISVAATLQAQVDDPPPPPPPPPPQKVVMTKFTQPVITIEGKQADEFYKQNPSVAGISRQGNIITLEMKDKTKEKYDMSRKEEKKNFTDKYGKVPMPDPPPPPRPKKAS